MEQRDYPGALESALQARELAGQIGDTLRLSVCLSNIGKVHSRRGEYALALGRFEETLRLSEEIGFKRGRAQALHEMGRVFLLQDEPAKALTYSLRSAELAEELALLELLRDNHQLLATAYAQQHDFQRAYEHHRLFKQFNDSTFNANSVRRIADMESAYQFDKERQLFEAEQQKKDLAIESQCTIIVTLAVAVVFMLLLALSLYRWYRLKRRTNRAILQQRAQIEKLQQLAIDRMNEELEANQKAMTAAELKLVQNLVDNFKPTIFAGDSVTFLYKKYRAENEVVSIYSKNFDRNRLFILASTNSADLSDTLFNIKALSDRIVR